MPSALQRAIDILGEDADAEELSFLWCLVSDLMRAKLPTAWDDPAWAAAGGRARVRTVLAAAVEVSFLCSGTEPEAVLRRLGLGCLTRRAPADE